MSAIFLPPEQRVVHQASLDEAEAISENNLLMAKESEGIDIPHEVSLKGVKILLENPGKGQFYVVKVWRDGCSSLVAKALLLTPFVTGNLPESTIESSWARMTHQNSDAFLFHKTYVWWIQSVFVLPPYRRQGLFTLLYKHVKSESQKAGACGLRLYADVENTKAHATYEAMGMVSHYKVYEDLNTAY